jgi:hypothetical protein
LFSTVVEPNEFTATVEQAKQTEGLPTLDEFWAQFDNPVTLAAAQKVLKGWMAAGYRRRLGPNHVVLEANGPSKSGIRTVVAVFSDGRVLVPFGSYAGQNSGIPIDALTTQEFRAKADGLFGFARSETQAKAMPGWLTTDRAEAPPAFSREVVAAHAAALGGVYLVTSRF